MQISTPEEYNRYAIAEGDFGFALNCIQEAWKYVEKNNFLLDVLVQMAIICYCRPFTSNEQDKHARAASKIVISDLPGLSSDEIKLHKKYMTLRRKAIAHSEYDYHPTEFDIETGGTTMTVFTLLRHELNLKELEALIRKLQQICRNKRIDYAAPNAH